MVAFWQTVGMRFLPFADAATADLPLGRLLRLSLFQVSVGMAAVLLTGTLNRVMIVELSIPASLVAIMIALPVLAAPLRVLIGHRSDNYRSVLGWRRVPYLWLGSLLQFGGLAIMPFSLLLMNSQTVGPEWAGPAAAAFAFVLTGLGMHMVQTAGLALATDLAAPESRPRVVALVYVVLLLGMIFASLVFGLLLADFSATRLIGIIQGAAVFTVLVNVIALWKQEARNLAATRTDREMPSFKEAWALYRSDRGTGRLLLAVALGSAAFSMQDVLLEPFGGEIIGLSVSETTLLTAAWALGALVGFGAAGKLLQLGFNMHRVAAIGLLIGIVAFTAVILSSPLSSTPLFVAGVSLIGVGGGLFAVATMLAAMALADKSDSGFAIGAWSAVQASAIGLGLAAGGIIRDTVNVAATKGSFGSALDSAATGYNTVYHLEIVLLFISLAVIGPLTNRVGEQATTETREFGLAELPG
jgi:BCD family chlorophyll transporter-like MFS transporter